MSEANLREVILTEGSMAGTRFTNLISIVGANFTGVTSLDDDSTDYLVLVVKDTDQVTYRQTVNSLRNLQTNKQPEGVTEKP